MVFGVKKEDVEVLNVFDGGSSVADSSGPAANEPSSL